MYFHFIKFCILLLLIILCFQGVFGLVTNIVFNNCERDGIFGCSVNYATVLSLINKANETPFLIAEAWLDFIIVVVMIVAFQFHRRTMRKIVYEVDEAVITPSDFTLMMTKISPNVTDDELKSFFESLSKNKILPIATINRSYDIEKYVKIARTKVEIDRKIMAADSEAQKELLTIKGAALDVLINNFDDQVIETGPIAFVTFKHKQGILYWFFTNN